MKQQKNYEETVTRWLDEGGAVDIVYLYFAKAVNSVNHCLPLTKLRRRSFQTSVNGSLPPVNEATSEVPQGLVLDPILFVIYVNDWADNLTIDHLLYADDVKPLGPRKQANALQSPLVASFK